MNASYNKLALVIGVLLIIAAGVVVSLTAKEEVKKNKITSFTECASAGYPIMESYPRQCSTGDETFTEEIKVLPTVNEIIVVETPKPNAVIKSPVTIKGKARGNWYFEASFPFRVVDAAGTVLAQVPVQAQGEWMTTEFVPFEMSVPFKQPTTTTGMLIFEKDNPSGLPQNAAEVRILVRFSK